MPLYTYRCQKCNYCFESLRSWQKREDPNPCPKCEGKTKAQVSSPSLGNMDNLGRTK